MTQLHLLPSALGDLFAQATHEGYLTKADQYGLLAALLNEASLSEDERSAIDRLLRAVMKKRIVVVNELSMLR